METASAESDLTGTVAKHYNDREEVGLSERTKSRIFYLRNFNNWIKSMAIQDALNRLKEQQRRSVTVLDLCSGKGGDLLKWKKGDIDYLVCADIAGTSVEQCEGRFKEMLDRGQRERNRQKMFVAEFITADCSKQRLKDLYKDRNIKFDLVSCQFSFHYSFESLQQAEMMLQNACECLKPGGYFIGTIPNAYELVKRLRASDGLSFGNEVFEITFDEIDKQNIPLFGAKYHFRLEGVVDCPEFVVYFPLLQKMAEKYQLKLLFRIPFAEYFHEKIKHNDGRNLIGRMQGLEPYPADHGTELMSSDKNAYHDVQQQLEHQSHDSDGRTRCKLGTLSQAEWEAATVYLVFMFHRQSDVKNVNRSDSDAADTNVQQRKRPRDPDDNDVSEASAVPTKAPLV